MKNINCITLSDSELVEKSIHDTAYFKCLYERYEKKLLIYIHRLSNVTDEEALDILQESFIKIWRNLNDFDPELSFNSWIYRIVHHQTISEWRKSISYGKNKTVDFEKSLQYIPIDEVETNYDKNEQKVMEILNLLPENYKVVLILKYFESKNYEEISDILKIPEGTVATNLNRAKKKFSELAAKNNISFFI